MAEPETDSRESGDKKEHLGFNAIREIQRKEQEHTPLQPLPHDFYLQVALYFSALNRTIKDLALQRDGNEFAAKVLFERERELENARYVVKDIFSRRIRKILLLVHEAVFTAAIVDTGVFTSEEKEIFESLNSRLADFNSRTYSRLFVSSLSAGRPGFLKVKAIEQIPAFIGPDLKTYGPFEAGTEAEIPEKNAALLLDKGLARRI